MLIEGVEVDLLKWFIIFFIVSSILTCICIGCRMIDSKTDITQMGMDCCICPRGFVKRPPKRIVLLEPTTRIQQAGFTIYCVDRPMPATNLPYHFDRVEVEQCLNTLFGTRSIFLPETTVAVSIPARGFCSTSEFHMFSKQDVSKESPTGYSYEMVSSSVQAASTDAISFFGCSSRILAGVTIYLGIGGELMESAYRINCNLILMKMIRNVHRYHRWIPFSRTAIYIKSLLRDSWRPVAPMNYIRPQLRHSDAESFRYRIRQSVSSRPSGAHEEIIQLQRRVEDMFVARPITCQPTSVTVHMGLRRPSSMRSCRIPADINLNVTQITRERPPPLRIATDFIIDMPLDTPSPVEEGIAHNKDLPPDYDSGVHGKHLEDLMTRGSSEISWNSENGVVNVRSKRATNSNLHQVNGILAPFARLTHALDLEAALFDSDPTINQFADKLLDSEPSSIDSLLSFDSDFPNKIRKSLDGSSIQELVEGFEKIESSLKNLKQKPLELSQKTLIEIRNVLDAKKTDFPNTNQLLESFERFKTTLFEHSNFGSNGKNFQKKITQFLNNAKKSRRVLRKMRDLKISADLKTQFQDCSKLISKIFPKDLSSIFPMKTAERIGFILRDQKILNKADGPKNLEYFMMQDETTSLELLRKYLNGSIIRGSLSNPELMKKLENDLKPILALGGSQNKFKTFIYKFSTNSQFNVLLEPFERLDYIGSPEEYNTEKLKWFEKTYGKWQTGFNLVKDFYLGVLKNVDDAEKHSDGQNFNYVTIEKWLEPFDTAKMDAFENELSNINSKDTLQTFRNDNAVFKSVGSLVSVSAELQKFKAAHEALSDLENLSGRVQDAETNLLNFVEEFMEELKDERLEKMKLLAQTVSKFLNDGRTEGYANLEEIQHGFKGEFENAPKLCDQNSREEKEATFIQKHTDFVNDVYQNPRDKLRKNIARKILKVPRSQKYVEEMYKDIVKLEKELKGNSSMARLDSILKVAENVRNPEISGRNILRALALAKSLELTENFELDQAYVALEKVEDLDLDFVSLQSANLTDFQSFLNEELAKPVIIVPDDSYNQPWIFIFILVLFGF
ncbi:Protein CBG25399 [Caenorhabditis briggsae]|uniref:Protein CBG25399 n=1 Tax=Caenorhabditis briggsae TaxID=6238 RepID=B6IH51_CAEBR|nr:Protein CBG25399 [Caenorhabditis briggsae]CAR99231.1 Protein CBG25399 [Caenorhabditis briggsae]